MKTKIDEVCPIAIIGVGNYLMGDEGVGVHAIEMLRALPWPDDVELIDGATGGIALLHIIEGRRLAIVIDCADFGGKPGEVEVLDPEMLARTENKEISLHATDLLSVLELAKTTIRCPAKLLIIGIQPAFIGPTTSLSTESAAAMADILAAVRELLSL